MAVAYYPIGLLLDADNHASKLVSWYGCLAVRGHEVGLGWSPEYGPVWYVPYDCLLIESDNAVVPAEPLQSRPVPDYADPPQLGIPVDE